MTWMDGIVNILDRESLEVKNTIDMWKGVTQGWGITLDPKARLLYATDGSDKMTVINADTLVQINQFTVLNQDGSSQNGINELEFVDGYIWANIFYVNGMVKIDPKTGMIVEEVDFTELHDYEMEVVKAAGQLSGYDTGNNVCNGIAYDPAEKAFYVTGKRWNLMFKISLNM